MTLPLSPDLAFGMTMQLGTPDAARQAVTLAERLGYQSVWVGDHVAFTGPIHDALMQLAHASALSNKLTFGTAVLLLPLRHPTPIAKMLITLDHLSEGRLILGVGVGGEFPGEFAACGVPVEERGARLTEGIEVLRKLWSDRPVSHDGRFYPFPEVQLQPGPVQPGGPPIWCGGRQDAALRRCGRLADGYISYVVSPDMYRAALQKISEAAEAAGREIKRFDTAHLLFARVDKDYETALDTAAARLSARYGMDFRRATGRYCAVGTAQQVAETLDKFRAAGMRYFVVDMIAAPEEQEEQFERFMADVVPLLG